MDKLNMKSKDITKDNIEKIERLFPNVITEIKDNNGNITKAIDFELLQQELSGDIVEGDKERYQLTWPGKKEAILMGNTPIDKTLRPVIEDKDKDNWNNTENLYIEGDNLEVLKLLQESYLNKVKCIYIDPPYNTGKDFVYRDNFTKDKNEYLEESGQVDEEGNRLFLNTDANGRYHSDWLTMMYPRLKLARNLLSEDGVIFISIDDNEVHNLRKICDEIFGERNFVGCITRIAKSTSFRGNFLAPSKDYLLCFAYNISLLNRFTDDVEDSQYSKVEKNGLRTGEYYRDDIAFYLSTLETRPNQRYFIECPDGQKVIPPGSTFPPERPKDGDGVWRWNLDSYNEKKDLIVFKKSTRSPLITENGEQARWNLYTKSYLNDKLENGNIPRDLFEGYLNRNGSEELKKLGIPFSFPKPSRLIQYLLRIIQSDKDSIILDFFSGSATTAHAVMQLNAEDGGNRKYIMVQLPEETDEKSEAYKAGYKTIAEIGKERIRRAAKKIKEETNADIDYGFRVFKVDSSNMKDVYYSPTQLTQMNLDELEENIKEDRTGLDLLSQVILEAGIPLSLPMETNIINGKEVYFVDENALIACFDKDIDEGLIKEIAKEKPLKAVFRDSSFKDCPSRINLEEIFKSISPTTEIKVL